MKSESSVAENWKNEEVVSQMGCSREDPNEVSSEKDNFIFSLEEKEKIEDENDWDGHRLRSRKRKRHRRNH